MKKLFTERARLVIYLEQSDVIRMTAKAKEYGQTLVEWARWELNDAASARTVEIELPGPLTVKQPLAHSRIEGLSVPGRSCSHGALIGLCKHGCKK